MKHITEAAVFKPKLSRTEEKVDATTRAARAIVDGEATARIAKTERLRAARLAMETAEGPPPQEATDRKRKPVGKRR